MQGRVGQYTVTDQIVRESSKTTSFLSFDGSKIPTEDLAYHWEFKAKIVFVDRTTHQIPHEEQDALIKSAP